MKKIIVIMVLVLIVVFIVYQRVSHRNNLLNTSRNVSLDRIYSSTEFGFVIDSVFYKSNLLLVGPEGLKVLDITNPANPILVSTISSKASFNDIFIEGDLAYIASGQRRIPNGELKIFDLSDLKNIKQIGKFVLPEGPISVFVQNKIAFMGDYGSGAFLIDVSDPINPQKLSQISLAKEGFKTYDQVLSGILKKYKVSNETELFALARNTYPTQTAGKGDTELRDFIKNLGTVGHSWWMKPYGNILYLPYDGEGLYTVDISDPRNPVVLGHFVKRCFQNSEYCFFNDVEVIGNYAFVAIDYGGLLVLDVSDPKNITEVKQVWPWPIVTWADAVGHMIQIETKGKFAFLTAGEDGLYVFDIKDPTNPKLLQKFSTDSNRGGKGCSWGIALSDSLISVGYAPCEAKNKIVGALEIFKISQK